MVYGNTHFTTHLRTVAITSPRYLGIGTRVPGTRVPGYPTGWHPMIYPAYPGGASESELGQPAGPSNHRDQSASLVNCDFRLGFRDCTRVGIPTATVGW
eukprot:678961-Rhodomonas_salina.5